MKLYTEEQLIDFLDNYGFVGVKIVSKLTPIELPSDEEIEKSSEKGYVKIDCNRILNWINGAKWMKEQILKQNK